MPVRPCPSPYGYAPSGPALSGPALSGPALSGPAQSGTVPSGTAGPRPSSVTRITSPSPAHPRLTAAVALGPACLRTLVSDSCTTRYTASASPSGTGLGTPETVSDTGSP